MTTTLAPSPLFRQWDNNGNPLAGGQLFTYAAGTSTPIPTYTDSTGSPNPNPVILNNRGEAQVWLTPNVAYKFTLTDSQGNQIWSVDQIVNSQLITLYGGVDTGVANAYVINFIANFNAYMDGVIVYWTASNANTNASTININGLGIIALTNQDGTALRPGEILANSVIGIMIKGGAALLLAGNISSGVLATAGTSGFPSISFSGDPSTGFYLPAVGQIGLALNGAIGGFTTGIANFAFSGFSGSPTSNVRYYTNGLMAIMRFPEFSSTSNATTFIASTSNIGLPFASPLNLRQWVSVAAALDNGAAIYSQVAYIETLGFPQFTINFHFAKNGNVNGWTNSGNKGLGDGSSGVDGVVVAYMLI